MQDLKWAPFRSGNTPAQDAEVVAQDIKIIKHCTTTRPIRPAQNEERVARAISKWALRWNDPTRTTSTAPQRERRPKQRWTSHDFSCQHLLWKLWRLPPTKWSRGVLISTVLVNVIWKHRQSSPNVAPNIAPRMKKTSSNSHTHACQRLSKVHNILRLPGR